MINPVRAAIAALVLSSAAWGAFAAVRAWTGSLAPNIHVVWADTVSAGDRLALEEQFQLVNRGLVGKHAWSYDLLDSRPDNIRALVEHPAVDDTHDLDRNRFTVGVNAWPGASTRWLWHRRFHQRSANLTEGVLAGCVALSGLALLWTRGRRRRSDKFKVQSSKHDTSC